jgi:aminopeptidase N
VSTTEDPSTEHRLQCFQHCTDDYLKKDQPIETSAENFSSLNYGLIAYHKSAEWLKRIENKLGRNLFDSCMKVYYDVWKFKHPSTIDFKDILESSSKQNLDSEFSLLNKKGYFTISHSSSHSSSHYKYIHTHSSSRRCDRNRMYDI